MYVQKNMFDEWRVKYIEYLCMRLIELTDKKQQQNVLANYIRLERNLQHGIWSPKDRAEVTPEKLLELAFDDAKVRIKLNNLGDKKPKKPRNRTIKQPKSVFERAIDWLKKDLERIFK